jgi:hypothetical protein
MLEVYWTEDSIIQLPDILWSHHDYGDIMELQKSRKEMSLKLKTCLILIKTLNVECVSYCVGGIVGEWVWVRKWMGE